MPPTQSPLMLSSTPSQRARPTPATAPIAHTGHCAEATGTARNNEIPARSAILGRCFRMVPADYREEACRGQKAWTHNLQLHTAESVKHCLPMDFRTLEMQLRDALPFSEVRDHCPDSTAFFLAMQEIRMQLIRFSGNGVLSVKILAAVGGTIADVYGDWIQGLSLYPRRIDDAHRLQAQRDRMEEIVAATLERVRTVRGNGQKTSSYP